MSHSEPRPAQRRSLCAFAPDSLMAPPSLASETTACDEFPLRELTGTDKKHLARFLREIPGRSKVRLSVPPDVVANQHRFAAISIWIGSSNNTIGPCLRLSENKFVRDLTHLSLHIPTRRRQTSVRRYLTIEPTNNPARSRWTTCS